MSALSSACLVALALVAPTRPAPRLPPQAWPVVVTGGVQALGFHPTPPSPVAAIGTEVGLVARRIYGLHVGLTLGGFRQLALARGGFFDGALGQRLAAPFGLYGDLDLVVGAQLWALSAQTWARGDDGRLRAVRAPVLPTARMGLAAAIGYDFGRLTRAPIRAFVRYQQVAVMPFMAGNGVPAMGIASLTAGLALEIGTWSEPRASK